MSSKLNILLPIETANRELDFALLLACRYARSDNRIFVGPEPALLRATQGMRGGLSVGQFPTLGRFPLLAKNLPKYRALKARGFIYLHLAAEGAVFAGEERRWREILAADLEPTVLEEEDYVCTWGSFQREFYLSKNPLCAGHVRATGHPRFDLLKDPYRRYFDEDVAGIRSRYGGFVLVNTNTSLANSGLGLETVFSEARGYSRDDAHKRLTRVDRWAHQTCALARLVRLVHRASLEFPDAKFIVRPHPSELGEFYRIVLRDLPNVEIIHQDSVIPWLLACRVMIHQGCTTGMEGYLAGANVITFKPNEDPKQDVLLASSVGIGCRTEEDVLGALHQVLLRDEPLPRGEIPPRAYDLLENLRSDAFDNLLSVMQEAESALGGAQRSPRNAQIRRWELRHAALEAVKRTVRSRFPERYRKWRYQQRKFGGFDPAVLKRKANSIRTILGIERVRLSCHSSELLSVETD